MSATTANYTAASALSDHIDTRTAATEIAHRLHDDLGGVGTRADLVIAFGSFHHRAAFSAVGEILQETLSPTALIGATAESVLGDGIEWEGRAGLTAMALRLPGVRLHSFQLLPGQTNVNLNDAEAICTLTASDSNTRGVILLADPFTTPIAQLLPLMAECRGEGPHLPISGALASGSSQPGQNVLLMNGQAIPTGLVGVSISGPIELDFLVSQGCRPLGEPVVVTRSDQNVIHELAGRPAMEVVQEVGNSLGEEERGLLSRGLLVGVVIDEYKERFGRGDFLIRNVIGFDQKSRSMAVADQVRVGQTIQLHVRDAATATEDLDLLLDLQELKGRPFASAIFTCNGRGTKLFDEPNHDVNRLSSRFENIAHTGLFAAGEIGPIGDRSFLHGHTLSAVMFRDPAVRSG